jgi:hypothetical protein
MPCYYSASSNEIPLFVWALPMQGVNVMVKSLVVLRVVALIACLCSASDSMHGCLQVHESVYPAIFYVPVPCSGAGPGQPPRLCGGV